MTDETKTKTDAGARGGLSPAIKIGAVALVCGLIGFGAVYATVGTTANTSEEAVNTTTSGTLSASTPKQAETSAAGRALPTGPGRNALSVGDMAMFVWRPEPVDHTGVAFKGPGGEDLTFTSFKGKVVLVNLWATWCAPCRKEMPDLNELQAELGSDDFEVVAVSLDRGSDAAPKEFLNEIGVKELAFYHDPSAKLGAKLKTIGMPATLLLDRDGREIGRLVGPAKWASEDAKRLIAAAVAAND